jgi:hypothetical protein
VRHAVLSTTPRAAVKKKLVRINIVRLVGNRPRVRRHGVLTNVRMIEDAKRFSRHGE